MTQFKIISVSFFLVLTSALFSQERIIAEFGSPTQEELDMTSFEADPEASGVVLFESSRNYVKHVRGEVRLIKEVHRKLKIIDVQKFDDAVIDIYYRHQNDREDRVVDILAITHNNRLKTYLKQANLYEIDINEFISAKRFTFPNIKNGSVIEYKYRIETPFFFSLTGWDFQNDIPTIYSEFEAEIPANFKYKRTLTGERKLDVEIAEIKRGCFSMSGLARDADCAFSVYAMKNIPAFKEEDFMLSRDNYIYRVSYELEQMEDFSGNISKYSKTWKDIDKEFKYEKDIGRQLKFKKFFKGQIPLDILGINDPLEKAKAIYYFIQKHYTWNQEYRIFSGIRVKDAFQKKSGNIAEINLSLINALDAADLDPKLVLLSTRDYKIPSKDIPVLTQFNYSIATLEIAGTRYLLDATDAKLPFGIIPLRTLNKRGRIMDFKNGSSWTPLEPYLKNVSYTNIQLSMQEDESFLGKVNQTGTGYISVDRRSLIAEISKKEYVRKKERGGGGIEIDDYSLENLDENMKNLNESFSFQMEPELASNKIIIFPYFLETAFKENPFKLEERSYTIDFGYPRKYTYMMTIDINEGYQFDETPKSRLFKLPQETGSCSVLYNINGNTLQLKYQLDIKTYQFNSLAYDLLKEFFGEVAKVLTKEAIIISKI